MLALVLVATLILVTMLVVFRTPEKVIPKVTPTVLPVPPDSKYLYVPIFSTSPCTLSVVDQATVPPSAVVTGFELQDDSWCGQTAQSFDGNTLYLINYSGSLTVLNISDPKAIKLLAQVEFSDLPNLPTDTTEFAAPNSLCLSQDGTKLFVGCNGLLIDSPSGGIATFDITKFPIVFESFVSDPTLDGVEHVMTEASGQFLYCANYNATPATMRKYSIADQKVVSSFTLAGSTDSNPTQQLQKVAMTKDGQWLFGIPYAPNQVLPLSVINTSTGVVTQSSAVGSNCVSCTLSPDNQFLFVLNGDNIAPNFVVLDITTPTQPTVVTTISLPVDTIPGAIVVDELHVIVTDSASNNVLLFLNTAPYSLVASVDVGGWSYGL